MLDLFSDPVALCATLIDVESVSGDEARLADLIEAALRAQASHLSIVRIGNSLVARTNGTNPERVILAGHIDTVPVADNLPSHFEDDRLFGVGASDMKSGVALQLHLAAGIPHPNREITFIFYECEEIEAERNGLTRIARERPDLLAGDFAVLLEPTNGVVEGGCQGTMRIEVRTRGVRAHSARAWLGENAIHGAGEVLELLANHEARRVLIDGLEYREGLQAVAISGGVAGNVIPDECVVTINYRFAPDRSGADAERFLRKFFDGFPVRIVDSAPGALPGLSRPAAEEFIAAIGGVPAPKYGWTDVARFTQMNIPAVNFGPGNPSLAHTVDESVETELIERGAQQLRKWLTR
ncbi:succinyl-diaminopimelate desuccinylase [mine drainage metagenome]|uniref:Succinyl-diaminopimelate desuccinylase n=1 Tax=mine drainage metagenome TaxID=410659 RepID=A0A1J5Q3Y8_9ZZZZ